MKTKSEKRRENVGASSVSLQTILSNEGRFGKGGFPLINEGRFPLLIITTKSPPRLTSKSAIRPVLALTSDGD